MSPVDINGFSRKLDRKSGWRKKEISDISLAIDADRLPAASLKATRRAAACLLYAHWEGFVRDSIELFLDFVRSSVFDESEVNTKLRAAILLEYVDRNRGNFGLDACARYFDMTFNEKFSIVELPSIGKLSGNVSYETFVSLISVFNFEVPASIEVRRKFINVLLLHSRNQIAHGHGLPIEAREFADLKTGTLELIDRTKDLFIDGAFNARHKL